MYKRQAYKLFFNTAGTQGEISDSLREILRYMNDPKNYPVEKAELPLIRSIDEAVGEAKMSDEWRHAYMIYQVHQQDAELRGRAEGISIGVKQEKVNAAKGLLREGIGIDMISRVTGLSVSEINKLKTAPSAN